MKPGKFPLILILTVFLVSCASSQARIEKKRAKDLQDQYELALVAMKYSMPDEAIRYLNNALSLNPNHQPSYFLLGLAHSQKKNYKEAAAAFEKSLELKPDDVEARIRLGDVYRQMGLSERAGEEYKKAYALDESSVAGFNLALLSYEQDKLDQALEYVRKSIQKGNHSVDIYNLQGVILNKLCRYPEAIESFQSALKIDPNHAVASINLAVAHINNNELNKAREVLSRILPFVQDQQLKDKITEYLKKIKELSRKD
ncbi:MAG: tetratricopeptide repeat protein [Candidatus Aminicenantes bacterium]|nr:tetratricopeptide repeat protein [Candidatus Aminicenantes bacterium]MDH5706673.1 tetratricopeptide repeat protein [Candidatus Aminicenantes bacterium]